MKSISRYFSSLFLIIAILKAFEIVQRLLISYKFGLSDFSDVYWSLLVIPDALIILIGIDSLKGVVNSEFANKKILNEDRALKESFSFLLSWVVIYSGIVFIWFFIFEKKIIDLFLPGFSPEKKNVSYDIIPWFLAVFFLKSIYGFLQSVSNSLQNFFRPNLLLILVPIILIILIYFPTFDSILVTLSVGNFIAFAVITFILLILILNSVGFTRTNLFRPNFLTKQILLGSISTLALIIFNQLFLSSKNYFASYLPNGSISILNYSSSASTPVTMIIFMSTFGVLLTNLSIKHQTVSKKELKDFFFKVLFGIVSIVIPIVVFFIVFKNDILTSFYLRGNFKLEDIYLIEKSFVWDSLSIFSYVIYILPTALFLAIKKYRFMSFLGCFSYILGIVLNYFGSIFYGYVGLSFVNFFITLFYGILLLMFSQKSIGRLKNEGFILLKLVTSGIFTFFIFSMLHFYVNLLNVNIYAKILLLVVFLISIYFVYYISSSLLKVNMWKQHFQELFMNLWKR